MDLEENIRIRSIESLVGWLTESFLPVLIEPPFGLPCSTSDSCRNQGSIFPVRYNRNPLSREIKSRRVKTCRIKRVRFIGMRLVKDLKIRRY